MDKITYKLRTVTYYLFCGGAKHHGSRGKDGVIAPGEEHYHSHTPYAVRCTSCGVKG